MSLITQVPEPNIWDAICKDFSTRRPPYDDDEVSVQTEQEDYDASKFNPVFYGKMRAKVATDLDPMEDFDPSVSHPACVGYALVDRPKTAPPPLPPEPPNKKTCSPRLYLEHYVFPILLPAMEKMLKQAKIEKCFERKRTKFNACDFLTEYLYRHNVEYVDRKDTELLDIPFVKEWLKDHPRPPLPKSLLWSEEEATLIIQSFYRGYRARCDPEIQDLRKWQREWKEENENIAKKVNEFWDKKMPGGDVENEGLGEMPVSQSAPTLVVHQDESGTVTTTEIKAQSENNAAARTIEVDPDSLGEEEQVGSHGGQNCDNVGLSVRPSKDYESSIENTKELDIVT